MSRPVVLVLWLSALCSLLRSQTTRETAAVQRPQIKDLKIPRIASKPQIDEFLGGRSRSDMLHIEDFRQPSPGDGVPVSQKTSAWIAYDEKTFYAVFVCDSPAGQLRARMGKREDILSDDIVAVFLDTCHDHQRPYEFFVNPLGIQADAITSEGQNDARICPRRQRSASFLPS
jgi:hypothetical protein